MSSTPFQLRYTLSRTQRLLPLLAIWGRFSVLFTLLMFTFFATRAAYALCVLDLPATALFGALALGVFFLYRGLFNGLLDVLTVPARHVDILIEENAAGILIRNDRMYLFLDGITSITQYRPDLWTLHHFNGAILHIPTSAITDEQLHRLKTAMEHARTPAGIQAAIERGRRIQELQNTKS